MRESVSRSLEFSQVLPFLASSSLPPCPSCGAQMAKVKEGAERREMK